MATWNTRADDTFSPRGKEVWNALLDRVGEVISIRDYVVGDGVTDDTSGLSQALSDAETGNKILDLGDGLTIKVTSLITRTAGCKIVGRSTITHPKNLTAILWDFALGQSTTISSIGANTNYPALTGNLVTPLTVSSASGFSRGDVCLIHSEDTYAFDTNTKRAELVRILEISGTTVYVHGCIRGSYSTTMTLNKLSTEQLEIDGPTFACSEDPYAATGTFHLGAVQVVGAVRPKIRATFRDDTSAGLNLISCWAPQVEVTARNLRDKAADNALGYAVVCYGATRYGRFDIKAERVRHAWTNGTWGTSSDKRYAGTVRNNEVSGDAVNTTGIAWDTHAGAFDTSFRNCTAKWMNQDADAASGSQMYGYQDRGCGTRYTSCHENGLGYGWFIDGQTSDYGEDNITELHDCTSNNVTGASTAPGIAMTVKTSSDTTRVKVFGGRFIKNTFSLSQAVGEIEFHGTVFDGCANLRWGRDNTVTMLKCTRLNQGSSNVEAVTADEGTTLTIDDYYAEATSFGAGGLVTTGSTAGTTTINAGTLSCNVATTAGVTQGTATLTLNRIPVRPRIPSKGTNPGDANRTLAVGTQPIFQNWASTLTADRTCTLSTTGAVDGDWFHITRSGGGAFNLNVGTGPLKALPASSWCIVVYDGSAWYLAAYGAL